MKKTLQAALITSIAAPLVVLGIAACGNRGSQATSQPTQHGPQVHSRPSPMSAKQRHDYYVRRKHTDEPNAQQQLDTHSGSSSQSKTGDVVFKVTGSGKADITYGTARDTISGNDHKTDLGSYAIPPFQASMPYNDETVDYNVTAQLAFNHGKLICTISRYGKVISEQHTSPGHNFCHAEVQPNESGTALRAVTDG